MLLKLDLSRLFSTNVTSFFTWKLRDRHKALSIALPMCEGECEGRNEFLKVSKFQLKLFSSHFTEISKSNKVNEQSIIWWKFNDTKCMGRSECRYNLLVFVVEPWINRTYLLIISYYNGCILLPSFIRLIGRSRRKIRLARMTTTTLGAHSNCSNENNKPANNE